MHVHIEGDEVLTCYLQGEIDHHSAAYFRDTIDRQIERKQPKVVILDFSDVGFMDSSGVGLCMGRYRLLLQTGAELRVQGAGGSIRRVFLLSGLNKLMSID